jgi:hypothetical protein
MNIKESIGLLLKEVEKLNLKHCNKCLDLKANECTICRKDNFFVVHDDGAYLNIKETKTDKGKDSFFGFVLEGSNISLEGDIIVDLNTFIEIFKLKDFEKIEEKYNQYILFI